MATREYGFMGEPFPSKKFQSAMAEYLGHTEFIQDTIQKPSYDELLQEVITLKAELDKLRNQQS